MTSMSSNTKKSLIIGKAIQTLNDLIDTKNYDFDLSDAQIKRMKEISSSARDIEIKKIKEIFNSEIKINFSTNLTDEALYLKVKDLWSIVTDENKYEQFLQYSDLAKAKYAMELNKLCQLFNKNSYGFSQAGLDNNLYNRLSNILNTYVTQEYASVISNNTFAVIEDVPIAVSEMANIFGTEEGIRNFLALNYNSDEYFNMFGGIYRRD